MSSSTSTSRSSAGSVASATAITGSGQPAAATTRDDASALGWEYVHVCVDDATRLVYVEVLDDEKAVTAIGFLRRAVAHFAAFGIRVERLMTDNGSAYRATIHALACKALGIKHLRTRPYRPRTNGKAERFIRTMLGGWAYGAIYRNSDERRRALPGWLDFYNQRTTTPQPRPPSPIERLHALTGTTSSGPTSSPATNKTSSGLAASPAPPPSGTWSIFAAQASAITTTPSAPDDSTASAMR